MSLPYVNVYRVEFDADDGTNHVRNGYGPFASSHSMSDRLADSAGYMLPNPVNDGATWDDFYRLMDGTYLCGVLDYDKLFEWFVDDILDGLKSIGFVVKTYSVPVDKVIVLSNQVLFEKECAFYVST